MQQFTLCLLVVKKVLTYIPNALETLQGNAKLGCHMARLQTCMMKPKRDRGIPAAFAAALTAAKPGIRGPLTGSMMTSESKDWPTSAASPVRMPATCHHSQCINDNNK